VDPNPLTARRRHACPACGAEAHWNPARSALVCPFCGTEAPGSLVERDGETVIIEHDLVTALRGVPDTQRGWDAEKTSVKCQSCQAISVLQPERVGQRCEFCGSAQLVPYEQVKDAFRPESLLPLKVSEPDARDRIRTWYRRQWLAPNALGAKALTDTLHGVYLPYWTFDASAHAAWTAEAGYYSYENRGGKRVRQVRWEPAAGELSHTFDDALVPASRGIDLPLLQRIEPFPTVDALVPYDAGYVAGWTVERYQLDLVAAAAHSRQVMDARLRQMCAEQVPGDTQRNLRVHATYSDQTFKHILVPIWLIAYTYHGTTYRAVVNGVTGAVAGTRPWSWIKIALLILLALVVWALFMSLNG
jgi:hypothetical protein